MARPVDAPHLAALGATALAAVGLTLLVRRRLWAQWPVRGVLTGLLLGGAVAYLTAETIAGRLSAWDFVPLQVCDFAIFVAAFALVTLRRAAAEIVWFWALAGTTLAMATPDVGYPYPDWRWLAYFGMHGTVVVSAVVLALGLGLTPRPGAPWRVFGWTLAYAGVAAIVNLVTGANFLYLRRKPAEPTLLDHFGPWPWYIAVAGLVGLALFHLLMLPFRSSGRPMDE